MQEFSSISVSTYSPDELTGQLNDRVNDGWNVVAIVPTGSTVTAYLTREATGEPAAAIDSVGTEVSAAAVPVTAEPAPEPAAEPDRFEVAGAAAVGPTAAEPAPQPAPEPAPEPAVQPTPEPAPEPAAEAAAAPAGWYADPSSRYELRYWDGTTWTEHVSRGGQQFTDPPVA